MNENIPLYFAETDSQTYLAYKYKISKKSRLIYSGTLLALVMALGALPFIYTQLSIKSSGVLNSSIEKVELTTTVSGRIINLQMKDNQKLSQGDTLLVIDASLTRQQDAILGKRHGQLDDLLKDAAQVAQYANTTEAINPSPKFQTGQYSASWQQYIQELEDKRNARSQAERIFDRYNKLYKSSVITAAEYERYKYDYEQASSAYSLVTKRYKTQWEAEASEYRNELNRLEGEEANNKEQNKLYTLTSPIDGSLQNLSGLQAGAYVFANQKVGEISPDTQLIAFCYIKPSDIGLISKGQPVYFQIDAFNYNQWGLLTGKVIDISDDIVLANGVNPVFKVKCSLDKNYLQLSSGYKGHVKKGMSFTARFMITERSLFQLLYDKVDDWVNPNII